MSYSASVVAVRDTPRHEGKNTTAGRWSLLALVLACLCGIVLVAAAVTSDGSDLRPAGGDLSSVLRDRAREVETRREEAVSLQREVDAMSRKVDDADLRRDLRRVAALSDPAGLTPVQGPGLRIALEDAPRSVDFPGLDPNLLVVHQQDIQAFVNALWAGGAEAVTLQGQRLISSIGIKCVGNTVVLDGVPYAPPYVIEAIGNQGAMRQALAASPEVATYTQYSERYSLGLDERAVDRIKAPAYDGSVSMRYATALD